MDNSPSNGWSPDGKRFVAFTRAENKTRLWDLQDDRVIWEALMNSDGNGTEELSSPSYIWSPSQEYLLVTNNTQISLLNAATGRQLWKTSTKSENLELVQFDRTEDKLVIAYSDKKDKTLIEFWDMKTGKVQRSFRTDVKFFDSFAFSQDGKVLKFGNFEGKAMYIDSSNGRLVKEVSLKPCGTLANTFSNKTEFSPSLTYLVARCRDKTVITEVATGKVLKVLNMRADFEKTIGFSGDEKVLVLENLGYKVFNFSDGSVKDIEDPDLWFHVSLNHDDTLLMNNTDYLYRGYEIVETQTGKVVKNVEDHPGEIKALAFSPDGNRFASGSTDCVLRIWDTASKRLLFELAGHTTSINSIEFASDGHTIVSASKDETITWNTVDGTQIKHENFGREDPDILKEIAQSPRNRYILQDLGDDVPFQLLDGTGRVVKSFPGLTQIQGFKFMPDEKGFLSAAYFHPLQLWDIESGKRVRAFDIGYSRNNVVAFDHEAKRFITGGSNRNILMFDVASGDLLWSLFPIDRELMRSEIADEKRRVKKLQDSADYAKRADLGNTERIKKIVAKFSHYGVAESFWDQKLAESGRPNKSKVRLPKVKATVAWFTLTNDSDLPVSIDTNSMIVDPKCKGLCNGAEISSRYVAELTNGETVVNGFDMYSKTLLPPKTSVYFSVSLNHLSNSKAIYLEFTFQKDNPDDEHSNDYGTKQRLYLDESALPK